MNSGDSLAWIQRWYRAQCNGEWEHSHGVRIDTLDNPGWTLDVDLAGTNLERQPFAPTKVARSEDDWIDCRVEKAQFRGAGGPANLRELVEAFRGWADGHVR